MAHPYYPTGNPRFNHVAMSLPAELLDEGSRGEICRFWSDVCWSLLCGDALEGNVAITTNASATAQRGMGTPSLGVRRERVSEDAP